MSDERTPVGEGGAVSVRVSRDGWRAHVPTALIMGIFLAVMEAGGCNRQSEVLHRLDDLSQRVARIEGRLDPRLASRMGAEGAGGTGAAPGD